MRQSLIRATLLAAALAAPFALLPVESVAMGNDPAPAAKAPADPNYAAGRKAIEAKDWAGAITYLVKAAEADPKSADIQNYLGYASRNAGDLDKAFTYYAKALELDPKHKGAHEYLGEAYLLKGDLAKAEEMLGKLDKLCFFTCAEFTELKTKIANYKAQKSS